PCVLGLSNFVTVSFAPLIGLPKSASSSAPVTVSAAGASTARAEPCSSAAEDTRATQKRTIAARGTSTQRFVFSSWYMLLTAKKSLDQVGNENDNSLRATIAVVTSRHRPCLPRRVVALAALRQRGLRRRDLPDPHLGMRRPRPHPGLAQ